MIYGTAPSRRFQRGYASATRTACGEWGGGTNDTPADKLRKQLARIDAELNERLAQIDAEADKGRVECWYNPPGPAGGADVALRGKLVLVSGDRVACVRLSQALNGFTPIDGR